MFGNWWEKQIAPSFPPKSSHPFSFPEQPTLPARDLSHASLQSSGPRLNPQNLLGSFFFTASTSLKHLNEVLYLLLLRAPRGKIAPPAQVGAARGAGAWFGSAHGTSPAFQATGRWRARAGARRNTECMGIYGGGWSVPQPHQPGRPAASGTESEPWSCRNLIMSFLGSCSLRSCSTVQARCGTTAAIFPRCLRFTEPARLGSASPRPRGVARTLLGARGGGVTALPGRIGASVWVTSRLCSAALFVESGVKPADVAPATDYAESRKLSAALNWSPCEAPTSNGSDCLPSITHTCLLPTSCYAFKVFNLFKGNKSIQTSNLILSSSSLKIHIWLGSVLVYRNNLYSTTFLLKLTQIKLKYNRFPSPSQIQTYDKQFV